MRRGTMRTRSTWVAGSMLAVFVASYALAIPLSMANASVTPFSVALLVASTAFMGVGVVLVAHRPGNAIGWIFSAVGLLTATGWLAQEYAAYGYLTRPGSLPGAALAAWLQVLWWTPQEALVLVFTLLLFPTGRLPSPRWRPVALVAAVTTAAITVLLALQPTLRLEQGQREYLVANPIGLTWAPSPETGPVGTLLFIVWLGCMAVAGASLVVRFRRSHPHTVERQQLKWFTYAGTLLVLWTLLALGVDILLAGGFNRVIFAFFVSLVPIAAGVAILRYRLYEIDWLINRTLVYGLLTAVLGGVYAGLVLVLGQLFGGIGAEPPSWVVAGATLAVAALFQPARRRIQAAVDRRFNRRRYNAARTVEAFAIRLRDELDLDALSAELLGVVDQTVQPNRVAVASPIGPRIAAHQYLTGRLCGLCRVKASRGLLLAWGDTLTNQLIQQEC
jgi:hypothetical protein